MAQRRPLVVRSDGKVEELPSSDTLPGGGAGASIVVATVDFGVGASVKRFDVNVPGATVGQKVVASMSLDMPAGVDEDEYEMDMLACAAGVTAADTVSLIVASVTGTEVSGQRNINLIVV